MERADKAKKQTTTQKPNICFCLPGRGMGGGGGGGGRHKILQSHKNDQYTL